MGIFLSANDRVATDSLPDFEDLKLVITTSDHAKPIHLGICFQHIGYIKHDETIDTLCEKLEIWLKTEMQCCYEITNDGNYNGVLNIKCCPYSHIYKTVSNNVNIH